MRCVQCLLEVGERLHELPRTLAREGGGVTLRAQMTHEAGEQALDLPHCLEREVRDDVSEARHRVTDLVPRERREVDMLDNEFETLHVRIELGATGGEEPYPVLRLVPRERDKPCEESEREGEYGEVGHSD